MSISKKIESKLPAVKHYNTGGCNGCDIEILAAVISVVNSENSSADDAEGTRRRSIITATGPANMKGAKILKQIYDETPDPKVVVSIGTCACSGGIFWGCQNILGGVDKVVPVDVYMYGCPVRPEQVIDALAEGLKKLEEKTKAIEVEKK